MEAPSVVAYTLP